MGFKFVKEKVIKALLEGAYEHECVWISMKRTSCKMARCPRNS